MSIENKEAITVHTKCPSCGGDFDLNLNRTQIKCPYCRRLFKVDVTKDTDAFGRERTNYSLEKPDNDQMARLFCGIGLVVTVALAKPCITNPDQRAGSIGTCLAAAVLTFMFLMLSMSKREEKRLFDGKMHKGIFILICVVIAAALQILLLPR